MKLTYTYVFLAILTLLLAACGPGGGPALVITATPGPAEPTPDDGLTYEATLPERSAGDTIALATQTWVTPEPTPTTLAAVEPISVDTGDTIADVVPVSEEVPDITPPTDVPAQEPTLVWHFPDAVEGEHPNCHRQEDKGNGVWAHLPNTTGTQGCHLTVTLPKEYQQVVLLQPGTLCLQVRIIVQSHEIQNGNLPNNLSLAVVHDGFFLSNGSDIEYDVRFDQAHFLGDLKIYPQCP